MSGNLFTATEVELLLKPERWRLVTSFLPLEEKPVPGRQHRQWVTRHTERHPQAEILFALSGGAEYGFLGHVYPCTPGTVLVFDSREAHDRGYPPGAPPAVHLWLTLLLDHVLVRRLEVSGGRWRAADEGVWVVPNQTGGPDLRATLASCRACADTFPALARSRLQSALALFLAGWLETLLRPAESAESALASRSRQADIVNTLCRHIRDSGGNAGTLDNLAHIAGYSKYHFWRLFKRHAGTSLHEFVDRCRLERVSELRKAGRSWKQISDELGFSRPSAFSRWYRPHRG